MKQKIANYTVIIERQKRLGTKNMCYMAYVPMLGIATEADNLEKVEKNINSLIKFHLKSLTEEGEDIPIESEKALVTSSQVNIPEGASVAH